MGRLQRILGGTCAAAFAVFGDGSLSAAAGLPACGYRVDVVGMLPCSSGNPPGGYGIAANASGYMVGYRTACSLSAFFEAIEVGYLPFALDLPRPAGVVSAQARGVNDGRVIVGLAQIQNGSLYRGFIRNAQLQWTLLEPQAGGTHAEARAVNNANVVVGGRGDSTNTRWLAFRWENGVYTDLDLPVGPNAFAMAISDDGAITGWMGQSNTAAVGFYVKGRTVSIIEPIGGGYHCITAGVNSHGEVAATSHSHGGTQHPISRAIRWKDGVSESLGTLPGFGWSTARGIGENGMVIGVCRDPYSMTLDRAFLFAQGTMHDLNDLIRPVPGLTIIDAYNITETGVIAGQGDLNGTIVALRIVPIEYQQTDLNHDCQTDVDDLAILLADWGRRGSIADIDKDGIVNARDLGLLLGGWGIAGPPPQPPW